MQRLPCTRSAHFQLLQKWSGCCFSPTPEPAARQTGNPKTTQCSTNEHKYIKKDGQDNLATKSAQKFLYPKTKTHHHFSVCINVVFHVTLLIVGLQDSSQFSISSHVEAIISRQDDEPGAAVPPANGVLNNNVSYFISIFLRNYALVTW